MFGSFFRCGLLFFSKVNRETFSSNFCVKNVAELLLPLPLSLARSLPGVAPGCQQALRASRSGSCFADSYVLPALMQKPSQSSFCSSLCQAVCEKEKNAFSFSLQAPAMKVGLALQSPSSKAFKCVINPSPFTFSKVQTQLNFVKCDLEVYSN